MFQYSEAKTQSSISVPR